MKKYGRIDANQPDIVDMLNSIPGCKAVSGAALGDGFPDLVVGRSGITYLLEVKDGDKSPSRRQLTDDQKEWHDTWPGHVAIVSSVDEALIAVGIL